MIEVIPDFFVVIQGPRRQIYCFRLQTLRDLTSKMNDVKSYVTETFTKISNLQGGSLSQDTGTGQTDLTLRPMVETIQNDVRQIRAAQLGAVSYSFEMKTIIATILWRFKKLAVTVS